MKRSGLILTIFVLSYVLNTGIAWGIQEIGASLTRESVKDRLLEVNLALKKNYKYQNEVNQEISDLQNRLSDLDQQLDKALLQVDSIDVETDKTEEALQISDEALEKKEAILNKRLRAMYKMNIFSICELFLNADSLEDGFVRLDMLQRIYEQDRRQIESLKVAKRKRIEKQKVYEAVKYNKLKVATELRKTEMQLSELLELSNAYQKKLLQDHAALEEQEDELLATSKGIETVLMNFKSDYTYFGSNLKWPAIGHYKLASVYGMREHPIYHKPKMHTGVDISTPFDAPITTAEDGIVILSRWYGSYGKTIIVDHGSGYVTLYAHNNNLVAKEGDVVKRGQILSLAGSTGNSTGPHLHFEVRINGKPVNPLPWITK